MLRVGITGGIGSGKSTVAFIFSLLGIPVFKADEAARELMETSSELQKAIIKAFGAETYSQGKLNRAFLGNLVFKDPAKLKILNNLVHPIVIKTGDDWSKKQTTPYNLKESALFFETGSNKQIDFMIGVYTPEALRIKRVMSRNNLSEAEVRARINKQMPEEEKMNRCDALIHNDGNHFLIYQVLKLHQQILERVGKI